MKETRFGRIVFIPGQNDGKYPFCNSLYLEGDQKVIIDPGSNDARLFSLKEDPGVDLVWLSHFHEDHFMFLGLFSDRELWMPGHDAQAMLSMEHILDLYGIDDAEERKQWASFMTEHFNYSPREVNRTFDGEETIDLGGLSVVTIPAPGHTAGNTAFYVPDEGLLFIGDYDLLPFGPWYGDRDSDIDLLIASARKLREIPAKVWVTSHAAGFFTDDPRELWDRYLAVIDRREQMLIDFLSIPRTIHQIIDARIVYKKKKEPALFFDFGEQALMMKHLHRLMKNGVVVMEEERYRLA
ncbi:MAG: MBL fold metallo-hydrolase [Deltaproteobacteria bacterium]|nr:MBL fold metallo-hydrolase [Candidatus Zymogenaceae bacterium]